MVPGYCMSPMIRADIRANIETLASPTSVDTAALFEEQKEAAARRAAQRAAFTARDQRRRLHRLKTSPAQHSGFPSSSPFSPRSRGSSGQEKCDSGRSFTSQQGTGSDGVDEPMPMFESPFETRHGRRFLRHVTYPLPVDLPELHRQNMRTLLACRVFGRAVCSPELEWNVPRKVLELGCGTAYWSAMCHDYFSSLGRDDVAFTGLDIAPLAPDLSEQGVNWTFVEHDFRLRKLPFSDGEFDLIMCKDLSLATPPGKGLLEECVRLLSDGGTMEVWESDHVIRALAPRSESGALGTSGGYELCGKTGSVIVGSSTSFVPVKNKNVDKINRWMTEALESNGLLPNPCSRIGGILYRDARLTDMSSKRIAIPLSELRWKQQEPRWPEDADSVVQDDQERVNEPNPDQAAIRHAALLSYVQSVEGLESMLCEVNGMNSSEWNHWLSSLMSELLDPAKAALSNGECLEFCAWWATKQDAADKMPKARSSAFIVPLLESTIPL